LLAAKVDKDFEKILDISEKLTDYAVDIRYPLLLEDPTSEEAEEAIKMAEKIKEMVQNKITD